MGIFYQFERAIVNKKTLNNDERYLETVSWQDDEEIII
jgi:hypothetical protein